MPVTLRVPINLKIQLPHRLPRQLLEPILRPLWRGPKTTGTVLHDRVAVQKTLFLCKGCEHKMHPRHLKTLQYAELRQFHAVGLCDGCQKEMPCALWMWQGSKHIQRQEQESQWQAVAARERLANQRGRR